MAIWFFLHLIFASTAAPGAVYPAEVTQAEVARLMKATAWVRGLDEATLRRLVPVQSGLTYVGCPNCTAGRQERQLRWDPERPDEVSCEFCGHAYPSVKYAVNGKLRVQNPLGETHEYPYWENTEGYKYYFAARRDELRKLYLSEQARNLAKLYIATGDKALAQRAGWIVERFAEVFTGWCYKYDYPFRPKRIFEGLLTPDQFLPDFRTARWGWWGYTDMPVALLETYDWIGSSGVFSAEQRLRIERDLFRNAAEQQLANRESNSNMSPTMWAGLVRAGRIVNEPRYVNEPLARLTRMVEENFFYDGAWREGAPSYHRQTLGGLKQVLRLAGRGDNPPVLANAETALRLLHFPDGHAVPVHDTWASDSSEATAETKPFLLPALGHAALGGGRGAAQWQAHLTWSGGYGHQHADALSLNVYAGGRERISDLGYTHTRYRAWTLATASHNTVVVDGRNQENGRKAPSDGNLRFFDVSHPRVQVVSAEARRAHSGDVRQFQRTLVAVDADRAQPYIVDWFEVEGGVVHDYFLHGDANLNGRGQVPAGRAVETLLPPGMTWKAPAHEGELNGIDTPYAAYGFLQHLRELSGPPLLDMDGMRIHWAPEKGDRLLAGVNPSIRMAGENDADLERHARRFMMLRRSGGKSLFAVVMESAPGSRVLGVERIGKLLKVRLRDRVDEIDFSGDGVRIASLGYNLGASIVARAKAIGGDWLTVDSDRSPAIGSVVRVVTADGWVYPLTVAAVEPRRIRIVENGALRLDGDTLELKQFPRRTHRGVVRVEWRDATP